MSEMGIKDDEMNKRIDEISVKDIFIKIKEYLWYFWSKKAVFLILLVLFVGFFIYRAKTTPFNFIAETKFFLEGNEGGSSGGLGVILGQIGMGGKKTNPYQIIEVAESKIQVTDILFERIGPDSIFIANKILEIYDLPNQWIEDNSDYKDFKFTHDSTEAFTSLEKHALLRVIYRTIDKSNNPLLTTGLEEDRGYYFIRTKTLSPELSYKLTEISYQKLKHYFEEKTREKLKDTRDLFKVKSDSIKVLLNGKINSLANYKDRNRPITNYRDKVQEVVLEGEISGLNSAYMESLKAYEMADYKYMDQSNYFMLIDKPMYPLPVLLLNWQIEAIKGGILALLLCFGFLFAWKTYHDIMES